MKKRLIFCFDGTWNNLNTKTPTNVGITAQSVAPFGKDGVAQVVYYDEGVGNARHDANGFIKTIEKYGGGLFGHGLLGNLVEAYKFLIFNYSPRDEIFVFGFSRGAFSARSFTGLLKACGVLRRSNVEKISEAVMMYQNRDPDKFSNILDFRKFRYDFSREVCVDTEDDEWRCQQYSSDYVSGDSPILTIKYLGVWDTVGALGVPKNLSLLSRFTNDKYRFHNASLSIFVDKARHAVAIDEKRESFAPTLWPNIDAVNGEKKFEPSDENAPYQEVWFPGTHGSVGGGGGIRGLSDEALNWVLRGAIDQGLTLDIESQSEAFNIRPNYRAPIDNVIADKKPSVIGKLMGKLPAEDRTPGPSYLHQVSTSARYRYATQADKLPDQKSYRPKTLKNVESVLKNWVQEEFPDIERKYFSEVPDGELKGGTEVSEEKTHTVVAGDSLGKIAKTYYGDVNLYKKLFRYNRPLLSHADQIYVGQEIKIPSIERLQSLAIAN